MKRQIDRSRIGLLKRNTRFLMLAWSVIIALSLGWMLHSQKRTFESNLHAEARAIHAMDMAYRYWIVHSGGVYVPASDETPPNPRLAHVPERDIQTPSGTHLTLMNSAYILRLVHEAMIRRNGPVLHIASLRPINTVNTADEWERQALEAFQRGTKEWASFDIMADGQTYFRYMKPMETEADCLKCHAAYGDKLGDIRGGVSVSLEVAHQLQENNLENLAVIAGHGLFWGVGMFGLLISKRRQQQAIVRIEQTEAEAALLTNSIAHAIFGQDLDGNCTFINAAGLKALGYRDISEVTGKNMHQLIHHTHADGSHYPFKDCPNYLSVHEGKSFHSENEWLWRKDGTSFPAEYWSYPVIQGGKVRGAVVTFLDISERLRIKDELRSSQSLLESIVENIPAMVFLKDAQSLRFELFNSAGERLLGYQREDLLGKNDHDFFPQEQADSFMQKDRAVLESRQLLEIPAEPIKVADGGERWLHTFKIGLYDEQGQATHLLGVSVDISDRVAMEEALRASQKRLSEAQRMAHLGHWELDLLTNELKWSDEIFRIFEIDQKRFAATYEAFLDAIHPDDRDEVNQAYTDSLKSRSSYQIHHRLLMKDGRIKYVLEKCETTFDAEGNPLRSLGTVQDVTATMFAEKALSEQQKVLELALEGTIHTVSMAVELRDPYTAGHQRRVAELSCAIAQKLGLD
ncbi:MAG: PAS domain S-box protein, partial [Gammaproteobacteria bacterium]|nr:PAS domain S-box protein [Gammaproteobacteria bacterium]